MNSVDLPLALPLLVFLVAWTLLGLLVVLTHRYAQPLLGRLEASRRSTVLFGLATLPPTIAAVVAFLNFAPAIGGLVMDQHCHAGIGCSSHVPVLRANTLVAIPLGLALAGISAALVWIAFSRLRRSVAFARVLSAVADSPHSASGAPTPQFSILENSEKFACCAGMIRPRLLVTRGLLAALSQAQLQAVLAHEQSHALRFDNLRCLIATVAAWPLPRQLSRALLKDLALANELACDRAAADRIGSTETVVGALLALGSRSHVATRPTGSAFRHDDLPSDNAMSQRIRALRGGPSRSISALKLATLYVAVYVAIALSLAYVAHHTSELALAWLA